MKNRLMLISILAGLLLILGCELDTPEQPQLEVASNQLVLNKVVAMGNSLTAGFESSGLVEDFQTHSYPYFIAQQIGKTDFEQPVIASPGIGGTPGKCPLELHNGKLVAPDLPFDPKTLLKNALLARPYDNLGIPGATLNDMITAKNATTCASGANAFFDIVLRNPNFGNTTQLQQALLLNPTLITLWIGNNDVLGVALNGGAGQPTSQTDFESQYRTLLTTLHQNTNAQIIIANIPYVTDIPYCNTLDLIFKPIPALGITQPVPVVFDAAFKPVDFGNGLYLPLLTQESGVAHLTLPALSAYQNGIGIPDVAALVRFGLSQAQAEALVQGMRAAGLQPTGTPIPNTASLTAAENEMIKQTVEGYNNTLQSLAHEFEIAMVDMNSLLATLNLLGKDGYSGKFVMLDPINTAFSLDGVHPNHGGYALIANAFIDKINTTFQLNLLRVDAAQFKGQYGGGNVTTLALDAVEQVKAIF